MKKSSKEMSLFKKLTALPYLLVFLALLMPLANVSCSVKEDSKPIAEATFYQIASGVDLEKSLSDAASWAAPIVVALIPFRASPLRLRLTRRAQARVRAVRWQRSLRFTITSAFCGHAWEPPTASIAESL